MTPDFAQKMFKVFHELETLTKDKTNWKQNVSISPTNITS